MMWIMCGLHTHMYRPMYTCMYQIYIHVYMQRQTWVWSSFPQRRRLLHPCTSWQSCTTAHASTDSFLQVRACTHIHARLLKPTHGHAHAHAHARQALCIHMQGGMRRAHCLQRAQSGAPPLWRRCVPSLRVATRSSWQSGMEGRTGRQSGGSAAGAAWPKRARCMRVCVHARVYGSHVRCKIA